MKKSYIHSITIFLIIAVTATVTAYFLGFKPETKRDNLYSESIIPSPTPEPPNYEQIIKDIMADGVNCTMTDNQGNTQNSCQVNQVSGDFAKGNMTQGYWIAQRQNSIWHVRVTGNGIPECKLIDEFSIPQEIYGNCIETSGELRHQ